jgi:hypothetical protein
MKARHGQPAAEDWTAIEASDGMKWVLPSRCGTYYLTAPRSAVTA